MSELAATLRISKKTLYRYFSGKEELVKAGMDQIQNTVMIPIEETLESGAQISECLTAVWKHFSQFPKLVSPELLSDIRADYPHIYEEKEKARIELLLKFEKLWEKGQRTGEIRPGIHPKVAIRIVLAIFEKVFSPQALNLEEFSAKEAVETITTVLFNGIFFDPPNLDN
jgi:AcrR family transcriptional regulator